MGEEGVPGVQSGRVLSETAAANEGVRLDPRIAEFVAARSDADAHRLLQRMLEEAAAPVIARVLQRTGAHSGDVADLTSATREELIARLLTLRENSSATPIRNFRGYVGAVAYSVWAQQLRAAHPARATLLNRLRYLLENRTAQQGFALWTDNAGEQWAGFTRWREQPHSARLTPKMQWLAADPARAAREAMGAQHWPGLNLAELLAGLFAWLDEPIEFKALLDALAVLLDVSDASASRDSASSDGVADEAASTELSPDDALKWQEYLRWLWQTLNVLSLPQRTAFLLHSDVTIELNFRGVASLRQIAGALEMSPAEFAEIWTRLPLEDLAIAAHLGRERQQVINLRRIARDRLAGAWRKWIDEGAS